MLRHNRVQFQLLFLKNLVVLQIHIFFQKPCQLISLLLHQKFQGNFEKLQRIQMNINLQEIKRYKLQITENNQRIFLLQNEKGTDGKSWVKKVDAYSEETKSKVEELRNKNDNITAMIKNIEQRVT
jgi:hypothetical protein